MPKQEIDADELFNLSLSILGLVLRDGPMLISELEKHYGVSQSAIKKAVIAITDSEDLDRYQTHFYLDHDAFESGEVHFSNAGSNLEETPALSARQITALATGLDFLAALPEFSRNQDLAQLRQSFSIESSGISNVVSAPESRHLDVLRASVLEKTQISGEYQNQVGDRSLRQIDPLRIDFIGKHHYLRGWCHKNGEVRSFRVDRFISAQKTELPISEAGSAAQVPEEVFGLENQQTSVKLAVKPEAAEIFWNFPSDTRPQFIEGELVGAILIGNLESLGRHVSRYGGDVRVLEPSEAKAAVASFARACLAPLTPEDED